MGGGGEYFDRDVTNSSERSRSGTTRTSEAALHTTTGRVHPSMLLVNRILRTTAENPVVFICDDTGSMGTLPTIFYDKAPMVVGQIVQRRYLKDPEFCLAAVGDTTCDKGPVQASDFCQPRDMDTWFKRMWLEGGGGYGDRESYETMAWFFAYCCEIPNDCNPFVIIIGDENFYDDVSAEDQKKHFGGGQRHTVSATQVFTDLKKKFHGNVFHIHRRYQGNDAKIVRHWKSVLGEHHVLLLGTDLAIADVTLGIFALMTRTRTLDEYIEDMRQRGQTVDRCREVRETLLPLLEILPTCSSPSTTQEKEPDAESIIWI